MSKLLVFYDHVDGVWILGSQARYDGSVQKFDPPKGRYPQHALWSFIPIEGEWGMLADHRHGKVLLAEPEDYGIKLGIPRFAEERTEWWKLAPQPEGYVLIIPYRAQQHALTALTRDAPVYLREISAIDRRFQEWRVQEVAPAPYKPLPAFDETAMDETLYNLEIVTQGGEESQLQRLFLTVGNELAMGAPLKIGTDPKAAGAQFRLVPVQGGRILSAGKPFVSKDAGSAEQLFADAVDDHQIREVEMINLKGARTFVSNDRVALRTRFLAYASWQKDSVDLTVKSWTIGEHETFTIQKVNAGGEVLLGEIKPGDSFALLAGNGKHLTDDRGTATTPIRAAAPHIAAWEIFTLGEPKVRAFRMHVKNFGHPLTTGDGRDPEMRPLVQRFGRELGEFLVVDRGDGMVNLRMRNWAFASAVLPATENGVQAGQTIAARLHNDVIPGIFFRLQVAPPSAWPDTPDLTMEKYRDPAEDLTRTFVGGLVTLLGHGFSAATGIPGGAAVFILAFNHFSPEHKVSNYDVLNQFRADILRDVKTLIAAHAELQAKGALQSAREYYAINYLNSRRENMDGGEGLTQTKTYAISTADKYSLALVFLSLDRDTAGKIKDTDQNLALVKGGLPVYAVCVGEYINALQEVALLHAYRPALVIPDMWLKTHDKYVSATIDAVGQTSTNQPLFKAVRVLARNGSKTLKHGDSVILRTPGSTNITAVNGGGGALETKTPASQIDPFAVFTIERVSTPPSVAGQEIASGHAIAFKSAGGKHWISAPADGGSLTAGATSRGANETFTLEIKAKTLLAEPEPVGLGGDLPYVEHIKNLRTYAISRYNDVRDMFAFLIDDRTKRIHADQQHWKRTRTHQGQEMIENWYALSFRDPVYNVEVDRDAPSESEEKPYGWDDPANCSRLQWGIDGYREHLRHFFYFYKYRYFDAVRPLLTIADDTQKLCEQMWNDPLLATEYSYTARTAAEYQV